VGLSVAAVDGYLARRLKQVSDFGTWVSMLSSPTVYFVNEILV